MHEMLHAIGFWHEQSRPERNQFVEVLWENIDEGRKNEHKQYLNHVMKLVELNNDKYNIYKFSELY